MSLSCPWNAEDTAFGFAITTSLSEVAPLRSWWMGSMTSRGCPRALYEMVSVQKRGRSPHALDIILQRKCRLRSC